MWPLQELQKPQESFGKTGNQTAAASEEEKPNAVAYQNPPAGSSMLTPCGYF